MTCWWGSKVEGYVSRKVRFCLHLQGGRGLTPYGKSHEKIHFWTPSLRYKWGIDSTAFSILKTDGDQKHTIGPAQYRAKYTDDVLARKYKYKKKLGAKYGRCTSWKAAQEQLYWRGLAVGGWLCFVPPAFYIGTLMHYHGSNKIKIVLLSC